MLGLSVLVPPSERDPKRDPDDDCAVADPKILGEVTVGLVKLPLAGDETSAELFTALPNDELPNEDATVVSGLLIENDELPKIFVGASVFCGTSGEQIFTPDINDLTLSADFGCATVTSVFGDENIEVDVTGVVEAVVA